MDPSERVARAKSSLHHHIEELGKRFQGLKTRAGIEQWIADHPWRAVGIAVALGAFAGFVQGSSKRHPDVEHSIGGMAMAALGAVLMKLVKGVAVEHAAEAMRGWLDRERDTSQEPAMEAFFDH